MGSLKADWPAVGAALLALAVGAPLTANAAAGAPVIPTDPITRIDVSIATLYDSNAAQSSAAIAAQRGLAQEDETASPEGDLVLARRLGSAMLLFQTSGGYQFNRVNTIRNFDHVNVGGGAGVHLGSCQGSVSGDYDRSQSNLSDLSLGVVNNSVDQEDVSATAICGRAVGLAPTVTVTQSWVSNSALIYHDVDARTFTVNAGLAYRRPSLGTLTVFGLYESATYPNRLLPAVGGAHAYAYALYAGGVRLQHRLGVKIDLTASISYTSLQPDASAGAGFSGLTYSGAASYHLTSRITFDASASRSTDPSNRPGSNFSINETYAADVSYRMGSRLTLQLNGDIRKTNYKDVVVIPPFLSVTNQTTYDVSASAAFAMSKRLSLILTVGDHEGRQNLLGYDYSSTTVGLTARMSF